MLHFIAILPVLAALLPSAEARSCYYDSFGRYQCTGLLSGAVAGIVVAAVIPVLLLCLLATFCMRRRRQRRLAASQPAYTGGSYGNNQPYPQQPSYGQSYQGQYGQPAMGQYNGGASSGPYQPPSGPPPQGGYAPPPGPPPAVTQKGSTAV